MVRACAVALTILATAPASDDQLMLVQWLFAAASLHPAVQPMSTVTPQQRDALDRKAAALMQRLLIDACGNETISALKYEGPGAIQASFQALGQVAGRGLMTDPHVNDGLQHGIATYFDNGKLTDLWKAAGLPTPASK